MTVILSKIALVLAFPHISTKITSIRYGLHARKISPGVWREATRVSPRSPGGVQNFSNSSIAHIAPTALRMPVSKGPM